MPDPVEQNADTVEADELPPWHPYDGCYGCRRGNAIGRRALEGVSPDGVR